MKSSLYPERDLRRLTLAWAVKLKVSLRVVVRVQAMRRKWGSCSSAGTVTLARDLLDQDTRFQDFVIVHELLHLRFPSHSHGRAFKAVMSAHVPGLKDTHTRWKTRAARSRASFFVNCATTGLD